MQSPDESLLLVVDYYLDKVCCVDVKRYEYTDIKQEELEYYYEPATNGDVVKAMFPKAKFDNAMPFTDGRWEIMNLDTENQVRATYKPTQLRTYADWWNAPYKGNTTA